MTPTASPEAPTTAKAPAAVAAGAEASGVTVAPTASQLAATTGVSSTHLGRAEPYTGPAPLAAPSLVTTAGSLLLVLSVILMLGWLLRRMQGVRVQGGQLIQVLASQAVGQREKLLLVQVADAQLLLGVTSSQIQLLHRLDGAALPPARPEAAAGFAERLAQLTQAGKH